MIFCYDLKHISLESFAFLTLFLYDGAVFPVFVLPFFLFFLDLLSHLVL